MTRRSLLFALGLAAALAASQAQASTVALGLYSTGVDAAGLPTPPAGTPDLHYIMAAGSSDGTFPGVPFVAPGSLIPPWAANTATAQWITPKVPEPVNGPYNYSTTFNLTGFIPGTASISGSLSADDQVVDVLINGVSTGITTPDGGFTSLHPFSITSGFVAGINTLEFLTLNNHEVVTGLIVDLTGTATAVPEPASLAMLGIGLTGLFAFRRFFKRVSLA